MKKETSFFANFSPRNLLKKINYTLNIIFNKNIDTSTEEGRIAKRERAIVLTSLIASFAKIIALLVPFITVKISRSYLGEEIYGLWSSVNSFFAVFAFADLGLGSGLQTNLSKARGKDNNENECNRLISSTFIMLSIVAGILIFLFLGVYHFVDWAKIVGATSKEAMTLAGPVFIAIVIPKLIDVPIALTQRTQVGFQEGYNYYLWAIFGSILSIVSVYLNASLYAPKVLLIFCSAAIPTIVSILNFIYYFFISKRKKYKPKIKYFDVVTCKKMLITGIDFLIIGILMTFGLSNMDSFIVGKIDSLSMAGNYSICLKVATVVNVIANMFSLQLWGVYGEALSRGDVSYVKKHVIKRSIYMLLLTLFVSICGLILSPIAFRLIVGSDFSYNWLTLFGMFLLQCVFATILPFFMILNGTGNVKIQILAYGLFTPLSFILKWILVPIFGVDIMPWVTLSVYLLIMVPLIIFSAFKTINKYDIKDKNQERYYLNNEYKFVVVQPSYGNVYDYCYNDIKDFDNIDLLRNYIEFNSNILKKIYWKHFSNKHWIPFRKIWNKKYYKNKFNKNDKVIFIIPPTARIAKLGALKNLRKRYPKSYIIYHMTDIVKKDEYLINNLDILNEIDLLFSFDFNDCKEYNAEYFPLIYSAPKVLDSLEEDIDVYFCGKAKNRFDTIMKVFYMLKEKGVKCLFFINGVELDKRVEEEGLIYLDKFMSYEQNLEYVKKAKCLLEIMQEGGNGYTLRTCEAIAYNKKIISNNRALINADFFNDNMILVFNNIEDIDIEFLKKEKVYYENRNIFSPLKLLEKVVDILENKEG